MIDLSKLSNDSREYAEKISKNGILRASKPKVNKEDFKSGCAAYVWRMVAFQISTNPKHHCMPCTAEFDIELRTSDGRWDVRGVHEYTKLVLDPIVSSIVDAVPKSEWHGIKRWGQAFGQIGNPQYTPDGSIVYR